MRERGVTLTELLVVIGIISVLAVALGFSYSGWLRKYKVEKTTKDIKGDMMTARARAMQAGVTQFISFQGNTYNMVDDTNGNRVMNIGAGDQVVTGLGFPKTPEYTIAWTTTPFSFSPMGTVSPDGTVWVTTAENPGYDYDCISVTQTKISSGWMTGGACNER